MINFKLTRWIIVASLTWIAGYSLNRYHDPEVRWIKSIYEDKVELADSVNASRRLLIVGGSGTHFGVDAVQIEEELGLPVFNIGLHAGLGLNALLASVSGEIRSGDIVLLIPEYGIITTDGTGIYSSSFGAAINRPGIGGFTPHQVVRETMLMGVPGSDRIIQLIKRLQNNLPPTDAVNASTNTIRDNSYSGDNLDERGSPVFLPRGKPEPANIKDQSVSDYSLLRLKAFRNQLEEQEATLVLGLPWVLVKNKEESLQTVQPIANILAEIAPIVYDKELNLKTNSKLFGDTVYHMSPEGREIRSLALAQQLERIVSYSEFVDPR